jgi:chorismate dehydratase
VSAHSALAGLRVGCVRYLNAKPLVYGWENGAVFDHPSRLAESLSRGELDVALVPTYELLRAPHYKIADGVAIASRGPVFSVFLAYRGELKNQRTIALDPGSLTSAYLLRCTLAEFHGMAPAYEPVARDADCARLLIGDQAIDFRQKHGAAFNYLDLGEEWTRRTGLPFVYAMWLFLPGVANAKAAADALREIKRRGVAHIEDIVRSERNRDATFCRTYLGGHIRYDLGPDEKRGIEKFRGLLVKHGLLAPGASALEFI